MTEKLSFIDHIDEFRSRIIFSFSFFILFFILSIIYYNQLLSICMNPLRNIKDISFVFISPLEPFLTKMKLCFFSALILNVPIIMYHVTAYILPALKSNEKKYLLFMFPPVLVLFTTGVILTYYIIMPVGVYFLISSSGPNIKAMLSISMYIDFFICFELLIGILFNIPLLILILGKIGIIKREFLVRHRKDAIIAIFIIGAVLTPPDFITQIAVAIPMLFLYELSVLLLKIMTPKKKISHHEGHEVK
ncbi:twin-arginine translocase subunit TatC [bacterium]|nr:twin-arginine translocase subunit TatC [bacterium]